MLTSFLNIRPQRDIVFPERGFDDGGIVMKRLIAFVLLAALLSGAAYAIEPVPVETFSLQVESAVLLEKVSGEVIYEKNPHERLAPASVTKVMTMLLILEAVESGALDMDETVTASAHARSMGGSQIWLEDGEQMSVRDMLKCIAVVSANDCAVAMAEHISGSEDAFVARMNQRAAELGCTDTHFTNCTGLFDDDDHYTSAWDLARMSRALISHDMIKTFTMVWTDTVRGGEFGLSNTNKLIRYFPGATGLKTGYTSKAGHCLAATAERDGTEFIAVVMRGVNSSARFEAAKTLLNYAFSNYASVSLRPEAPFPPVPVHMGTAEAVQPVCSGPEAALLEKSLCGSLQFEIELPESLEAPIRKGDQIGTLTVSAGEKILYAFPLVSLDEVPRMGPIQAFAALFRIFVGKN